MIQSDAPRQENQYHEKNKGDDLLNNFNYGQNIRMTTETNKDKKPIINGQA